MGAYPARTLGWALLLFLGCTACRAGLEQGELATKLVPSPVKYSVLLPDSYATSGKDYPLFFFLHGGDGDNGFLNRVSASFTAAWTARECPEMIVVTPSCERSFYMDYRDGSQKWESLIVTELLPEIRAKFRTKKSKDETFIGGISMGGMGSLRIAFKHPDVFGAVIAFEPGIEPAFAWKDVKLEDRFYRAPGLMETIYGRPMDEAYWAANNPANIARDHADSLKTSGLVIFLDAATRDSFGLDRGTDFLHRVLYDHGIEHEYRMVYGADHVGRSIAPRVREGLGFIGRWKNPPAADPAVTALHLLINRLKNQAGLEK
jgi:S-formylglutathione hydrolase